MHVGMNRNAHVNMQTVSIICLHVAEFRSSRMLSLFTVLRSYHTFQEPSDIFMSFSGGERTLSLCNRPVNVLERTSCCPVEGWNLRSSLLLCYIWLLLESLTMFHPSIKTPQHDRSPWWRWSRWWSSSVGTVSVLDPSALTVCRAHGISCRILSPDQVLLFDLLLGRRDLVGPNVNHFRMIAVTMVTLIPIKCFWSLPQISSLI